MEERKLKRNTCKLVVPQPSTVERKVRDFDSQKIVSRVITI
jgi:hypothetical protein